MISVQAPVCSLYPSFFFAPQDTVTHNHSYASSI